MYACRGGSSGRDFVSDSTEGVRVRVMVRGVNMCSKTSTSHLCRLLHMAPCFSRFGPQPRDQGSDTLSAIKLLRAPCGPPDVRVGSCGARAVNACVVALTLQFLSPSKLAVAVGEIVSIFVVNFPL